MKYGAMMVLNFYVIGAGALGIFAIAKIAFSGVPQ
jgi:threonine dehydrogenase-like Zn-dependent dehydrogenase